ncbi:ATP-binding protein [Roseateles oligotrophus]|uniref:histidine kinase n=1 Tax=Roseateles oligotrophus TaxID=1769250 RepID=A0ABT2YHW6_9BURK|nr:ATP-binding protein [Roseateles oligotrophus]MCV2369665.1 GAF domain-containing protein [Roseateles oligotrophus]
MDYFVRDEHVQRWDAELAAEPAAARRLDLLLFLSWHLRQRDGRRALLLAEQARRLLSDEPPTDPPAQQPALMRLLLVEAEVALFSRGPVAARATVERLEQRLQAWPEPLISIDLCILSALLANVEGQPLQSDLMWRMAIDLAGQARQPLREKLAEVEWHLSISYRNPLEGKARFEQIQVEAAAPTLVMARWLEWQGTLAAQASEYGRAAALRFHAFDEAMEFGQIQWAVAAASNAADALNCLNEHELALQWVERAIALARSRHWLMFLGHGLSQMGETLRRLGRLDAADECLQEGLQLLGEFPLQRRQLIAIKYRADLRLDQARPDQALLEFAALQQAAAAQQYPDMLVHAHRGQAQALALLGRIQEAEAEAQEALSLAQQTRHLLRQVECLRALAGLHALYPQLAPPPELQAASAGLHYLLQALELAHSIEGYWVPGELWEALAEAHAQLGDMGQAYTLARQAAKARRKAQDDGANQRLTVMQVMHQTDRARAEAEHQRSLVHEQKQRADALEQSQATLERLSAMGLDITSNLEQRAVMRALARHMSGLLTLDALVLAQLQEDGQQLRLLRVTPGGQCSPMPDLALSDAASPLARAAREAESCGRCAPLLVGRRLLGVLAVESGARTEFDEAERLLFRSLCAYASIALDNAQAYQRLRDAQAQLVQQAKLAALGSLVAGVAHELNTPIGNCLMAASTLQQRTEAIAQQVDAQALKRNELTQYLDSASQSSLLLMRGLHKAAELVQRFKQIAIDPGSESLQAFELLPQCELLLSSQRGLFEAAGVRLNLQVPPGLHVVSYPGVLLQVLGQLLENALLHGFAGGRAGQLTLRAQGQGDAKLLLQVIDDGIGIAPEHLDRIFEPFFSTRFGQGGSGLGLHICHNLVTALLQGSIKAVSEAGQGSRFDITLPLQPPSAAAADLAPD